MKHLLALGLAWATLGCVKAPEIVVVDRATALEQQAAGSFTEVEQDLARRAVNPGAEALTPDQLQALGIMPAAIVDLTEQTEADRVDSLLRQHCLGEGKHGLLVDTHDDCIGASDRVVAIALVDRTNRARLQLWRWLAAQRPELSAEAVREKWREAHLQGVVCRAWLQADDDTWAAKKC
ncbi:MAG: DUF1318 domain-containing protein [Pseudomonadota bacterium]